MLEKYLGACRGGGRAECPNTCAMTESGTRGPADAARIVKRRFRVLGCGMQRHHPSLTILL